MRIPFPLLLLGFILPQLVISQEVEANSGPKNPPVLLNEAKALGFIIRATEGWEIVPTANANERIVEFSDPAISIHILIESRGQLEEFDDALLLGVAQNLSQEFENPQINELSVAQHQGRPSGVVELESADSGFSITTRVVMTLAHDKLYVITIAALAPDWKKAKPYWEKILEHWEYVPPSSEK